MAPKDPRTFPTLRSVVILAEGFSPLLLRAGIIDAEIVGSESPRSITTPVLSQLTYPSGIELLLTLDNLQVSCKAPYIVSFEQLAAAAHDFLRRNELVQFRAVGFNTIAGVAQGEAAFISGLDGRIFQDALLKALSAEPTISCGFESTFPVEDSRCTLKIRRDFSEDADPSVLIDINIHHEVTNWKDVSALLQTGGPGERIYEQLVHRLGEAVV